MQSCHKTKGTAHIVRRMAGGPFVYYNEIPQKTLKNHPDEQKGFVPQDCFLREFFYSYHGWETQSKTDTDKHDPQNNVPFIEPTCVI